MRGADCYLLHRLGTRGRLHWLLTRTCPFRAEGSPKMPDKTVEPTLQSSYKGLMSDVVLACGVVMLLITPLAWPSLKVLFRF
jgi:hypothetical protein